MAKSRDMKLPAYTHETAFEQAKSFFDISNDIANKIASQNSGHKSYADKISYAVNASFSAELYLKAIMIMGKNGNVIADHDLYKIYLDFPSGLKSALHENYESHLKKMPQNTFEIIALTHSKDRPNKPSSNIRSPKFDTFENAIKSTSKTYVQARYFFEKMKNIEWNYSVYAPIPVSSMLSALNDLYVQYKRGDFKGGLGNGS